MYTPNVDFEGRVSLDVIKTVAKLTTGQDELMVNESYRFTVTFPFSSLKLNFAQVTIPDRLNFLVKI